ncbi:hypothetical protein [Crossiella cryophila]|uniref:Uncharacterized protein n=1 Tax=Crossiella cryophila TaxID=43355 RepID=A0A7W7CB76_9PSEU|nr:hypothetical protein [Crossiella cryophila]MBB4677908.1 hypothetical protein [Crossiella cryophila]
MPGERVQQTRPATPAPAPAPGLTRAWTPLGPIEVDGLGAVPLTGDKDRDEALEQIRATLSAAGHYTGFGRENSAVTAAHQRAGRWLAGVVTRHLVRVPTLRLVITGGGDPLATQRVQAVRAMLVSFGIANHLLRTQVDTAAGGSVRVGIDPLTFNSALTPPKPLPPAKAPLNKPPLVTKANQSGRSPVPAEGEASTSDSYAEAGKTVLKATLKLPEIASQVNQLKSTADRLKNEALNGLRADGWVAVGVVGGTMAGVTVYGMTQNKDLREFLLPKLLGLTVDLPSKWLPNGVSVTVGPQKLDLGLDLGSAIPALGKLGDPFRLKFNGSLEPGKDRPVDFQIGFTLEIDLTPRSTGAPR